MKIVDSCRGIFKLQGDLVQVAQERYICRAMAYHVRVKICGITNEDDACQAVDAGADAIGLNFYPKSPRWIEADKARSILRQLPPFVSAVGLFVNRRLAEIAHD